MHFLKVQEENSRLRDQLLGLTQEHQAQNAQQQEGSLEQRRQMERQFAMQIADHRAQKEMMERQLAQQEKIIDLLQSKLAVWGSDQNSQTRMQSI